MSSRSRRLLLAPITIAGVVLVGSLFAGPAEAMTRKQANARALTVLKPSGQKGRVVVFGLRSALGAGQAVAPATAARMGYRKAVIRDRKLGRRAWLFWMDLAHDARFEHPSRMLVLDDRTGKVLKNAKLSWYPLVNGLRPKFVDLPGYHSTTYQIWSGLGGRVSKSSVRSAMTALQRSTAGALTIALSPDAFKDDCMITIGLTRDPQFRQDFTSMHDFARSVKMRSFSAGQEGLRGDPSARTLQQNVTYLADTEKCKDILIYVSGHGARAPAPASILIGTNARGQSLKVTPNDLKIIMDDHPKTTFKVKLDSCFSGRFAEALKNQPNLLVLEASSSSTEVSYSRMRNPRNSRGDRANPQVPNPGRGEFTHGNIVGMTAFAESMQEILDADNRGGSLLAQMLTRAFELGKLSDAAQITGLTHPVLVNRLEPPPVTNTVPSHTHPDGLPYSYACIHYDTRPGAHVIVLLQGPGGYDQASPGEDLAAKDAALTEGSWSFQINTPGSYTFTITSTLNGFTKTVTVPYTVPDPPPAGAATGPFTCAT